MLFQFSERGTIAALVLIFVLVQGVGLYVGSQYSAYIQAGVLKPIVDEPANPASAGILFLYILGVTALILLVIRFVKNLLVVIEGMAVFFTSWLTFDFIYPLEIGWVSLGFFLALALTAWKIWRPTILSQNVALIFSIAGAGGVLGASLDVFPVLLFMLLLSVYDFVSVFITKHMVYMAKAITEKPMAFTAAVPCKTRKYVHVFQLGGGDMVIPLMFSVSLLTAYGPKIALASLAGALIALIILIRHVMKSPGRALPALPPVCAGAVTGFALGYFLLGV